MNDKRFETWWANNPARVALSPAAKELARSIWRAAQRDLATELMDINPVPAGASFDAIDALREAQVAVDERGAHTGWRDAILKVLDELMRRCREDNHAPVYRDLVALRAAIEANTGCTL